MMNRLMRMAALVLAAVLFLPAFALAEPDGGELKDRLLADFFDYTCAQEAIYGNALWAIDYVEQYDQARSWDRLQIARAAVAVAWNAVSTRKLPKQSMTDDDYNQLLLYNIDATFMEYSAEEFLSDRELMQNDLLGIRYHLADSVYESRGWENSVRHAGLIRAITEGYLQYWANTVDWLLQEIDDPARAGQFSAQVTEHCPSIASRRGKGAVSQPELEAQTEQLLTKMQGYMTELSELFGQMDADQALYEDAIKSGKPRDGIGDIVKIEGLPTLLPYPEWKEELSEQRFSYYWKDGADGLRTVGAGEPIANPPDVCEVSTPGVSREDLERYKARLDSMGMACQDSSDENGVLRLSYAFDGGGLFFESEGDTLTIRMLDNPVCFAPEWMINGALAG